MSQPVPVPARARPAVAERNPPRMAVPRPRDGPSCNCLPGGPGRAQVERAGDPSAGRSGPEPGPRSRPRPHPSAPLTYLRTSVLSRLQSMIIAPGSASPWAAGASAAAPRPVTAWAARGAAAAPPRSCPAGGGQGTRPARRRLGGGGPRPALFPSGRRGLRSMLRACSSRGRRASGAGSAPLRPARHGRV